MSSRKRLAVMLDRDVWDCDSGSQGMAGSRLAWDDLRALLCAGILVREEMQQHRVSTEGGKRRDGATGRVVFLQVMAAQRVARSAAKRSGRQVWVLPALEAWTPQASRRETVWAGGLVGWSRSDLVPSLWRSRRSTERRGSSLWCFCCAWLWAARGLR